MKLTKTLIASWLTLASVAWGQEFAARSTGEVVDGVLLVSPADRSGDRQVAVELVAPELAPVRIELPPTVVPPGKIEAARVRAIDLNADGVIDQADRGLLIEAFGRCPGKTRCRADLNGDGLVDDLDMALLMERFGATSGADSPPLEVGYVRPAPPNLLPALPPQARADGSRVIKLELRSANAMGLRVQFTGLRASIGLELRVYDPAGTVVLGPYSAPRLSDDGTWWAPTIFGVTIGLELTLRPGIDAPVQMPVITSIAYLYCSSEPALCGSEPGTALGCHNDVTCNPSWANAEARAVALFYFVRGTSCMRCSGALLNRGPGDLSPLFMTANHCISTQAEANSLEAYWHYTTPTCNGTPPDINTVPRTEGALVLKRHTGTDWTLLGLYETPLTNMYLGWNTSDWPTGDNATGVHHPRGTFKRISSGLSDGSTDNGSFDGGIVADVFDVNYTNGTTEGGSSGSPIFDSNRRVRGTLTGGLQTCPSVTARYGRFDRAWTNLRYYMGNADVPSSTVYVNRSVAGDPGNNGNTERGTPANPFNSVFEATFCVRSGQEVRVTPGSYNEQMTIRRPMTITREGSTGIVRIGAP